MTKLLHRFVAWNMRRYICRLDQKIMLRSKSHQSRDNNPSMAALCYRRENLRCWLNYYEFKHQLCPTSKS